MEMKLTTPTKIYLPSDAKEVVSFLTFTDKSVIFQLDRLKKNFHFKRNDPEAFLERVEELKQNQFKSLVFYDDQGLPWTYSGLAADLTKQFGWKLTDLTGRSKIDLESLPLLPWANIPHKMRYYQEEAVSALLNSGGHAAVELPTGSGKSRIILQLIKEIPEQTLIVTPFTNVTKQLCSTLEYYFGKKYVGQLGDGKKKTDKMITVANAQSAAKIERGSKEFKDLKTIKTIIFDESHMVPAESFKGICLDGVGSEAPFRFFLSATQERNDGSGKVLTGVTGPICYSKQYKELAEEKFLKKINAKIFKVPTCKSSVIDAKKETRSNLYENPHVARLAAMLADKSWRAANRKVVILIEEYSQFLLLKNHMTIPYKFAHGTVSKDAKHALPEEYWKCDTDAIIEEFNNGILPCIIGTTAISTGVDIQPTGTVIYLQGGSSKTKVKQGVGRGTRPVGPEDLWVCDIKVVGSPILERHANIRANIYQEMTDSPVQEIG